jgi:cbb3-type cytochrome c oxidase subunit III
MIGEKIISSRKTGKIAVLLSELLTCCAVAMLFAGNASGVDMKNPYEDNVAVAREGKKLFIVNCSQCHEDDGTGATGPDLTDKKWIYGSTDADLLESISSGRGNGMPSWALELSKDEIWKIITFIRSIGKK